MRARRVLTALALGLVALGLFAPPASAGNPGPIVVDDPADATGPGDILGFRIYQGNDSVVLQLRTKKPLDIFAAPAWNTDPSVSQIKFSIDGGGGPELEQGVVISPSPSGPNTLVLTYVDLAPTPRGDCVILSQPQDTIIRVRVHFECLPAIEGTVRASVRYKLDQGGDGSIDSNDRAPNAGFSPRLDLVA